MKKIMVVLALFLLASCGIPKEEYEKILNERNLFQSENGIYKTENTYLKSEIDRLNEELDQYRFGEGRLIALIEQAYNNANITVARNHIKTLEQYHPESLNKKDIKNIIGLVEREEQRQKILADEKVAIEKAAAIARRQGFENIAAERARVIDVAEAAFLHASNRINIGEYYIVKPAYAQLTHGDWFVVYGSNSSIDIKTNTVLRFNRETKVSMLLKYIGGNVPFELIELQRM
jgi:sugar-specific transcriptional regulator TrmB